MAKKRNTPGAFGKSKVKRPDHQSLASDQGVYLGKSPDGTRYPVILGQQFPGELGIINPDVASYLRKVSPPPQINAYTENIHLLLAKLKAEDKGQFLYRGQTSLSPALIPSIFRRAIIPGTEGDPVIGIDPVRFDANLTERDRIRAYLLRDLQT
jgi:hypothetical protein